MHASLLFNANGDAAVTAASVVLPTNGVSMFSVFRPTSNTTRQGIIDAGNTGMGWYAHTGAKDLGAYYGGTTFGDVNAPYTNFSTFELNAWLIMIALIPVGVTPTLYVGNITRGLRPAQPSSYGFRNTSVSPTGGTVAVNLSSAAAASDRYLRGRTSRTGMLDRILTYEDMLVLFQGGQLGGSVFDFWFGYGGNVATIEDRSGNGHVATCTSLTIDEAPPYRKLVPPQPLKPQPFAPAFVFPYRGF